MRNGVPVVNIDLGALHTGAVVSAIGGALNALVQAAEPSNSDLNSAFTSAGVFSGILAVAYFMLRRGDARESLLVTSQREELRLMRIELAQAEVARAAIEETHHKHLDDLADKLQTALIENAELRTRLKNHE